MVGSGIRGLAVFLCSFVKPAFAFVAVDCGFAPVLTQQPPVIPAAGMVGIGFRGLAVLFFCFIKPAFALIAVGRGFAPLLTQQPPIIQYRCCQLCFRVCLEIVFCRLPQALPFFACCLFSQLRCCQRGAKECGFVLRECFQNALPIGQRLLPASFLLCQNGLAPQHFRTYALCGGFSGLCQNGSRKFFCRRVFSSHFPQDFAMLAGFIKNFFQFLPVTPEALQIHLTCQNGYDQTCESKNACHSSKSCEAHRKHGDLPLRLGIKFFQGCINVLFCLEVALDGVQTSEQGLVAVFFCSGQAFRRGGLFRANVLRRPRQGRAVHKAKHQEQRKQQRFQHEGSRRLFCRNIRLDA